jgi:hypothetical protein
MLALQVEDDFMYRTVDNSKSNENLKSFATLHQQDADILVASQHCFPQKFLVEQAKLN